MEQKEFLTNQNLKGICKSSFELVRYAILLGRRYIKGGQQVDMSDLLDEVQEHPDPGYLDQLAKEDAEKLAKEGK